MDKTSRGLQQEGGVSTFKNCESFSPPGRAEHRNIVSKIHSSDSPSALYVTQTGHKLSMLLPPELQMENKVNLATNIRHHVYLAALSSQGKEDELGCLREWQDKDRNEGPLKTAAVKMGQAR